MVKPIKITPRLIKLQEMTEGEYFQLKKDLGLDIAKGEEPDDGFAKISNPLIIEEGELEGVLTYFAQKMSGARRISVEATPRRWTRINKGELTKEKIIKLTDLLIQRDLTFSLDVHNGVPSTDINDEIQFELINRRFVSTRLCIPGEKRTHYNWQGSETWYRHIIGVYDYRQAKPI